MLKYIGDFDRLKEFGFEQIDSETFIKHILFCLEECDGVMITKSRRISFSDYYEEMCLDQYNEVLYDLITAGLVIKEEE